MGAMGAAQTLDRPVGPPAGFEQEMGPLLLVHRIEARMIGAARPARVAEDEDALEAAHEGGGLGLAGSGRAGLELLAPVARLDQPLCASRDLGDIVMAEMIEQPVERGGNRRQRAKLLDEIDARREPADYRPDCLLVVHRHRALGTGVVGEDAHLPGRKGAFEIVDDIFARAQVDIEFGALIRGELARRRSRMDSAV
jgi:hypothetical protein